MKSPCARARPHMCSAAGLDPIDLSTLGSMKIRALQKLARARGINTDGVGSDEWRCGRAGSMSVLIAKLACRQPPTTRFAVWLHLGSRAEYIARIREAAAEPAGERAMADVRKLEVGLGLAVMQPARAHAHVVVAHVRVSVPPPSRHTHARIPPFRDHPRRRRSSSTGRRATRLTSRRRVWWTLFGGSQPRNGRRCWKRTWRPFRSAPPIWSPRTTRWFSLEVGETPAVQCVEEGRGGTAGRGWHVVWCVPSHMRQFQVTNNDHCVISSPRCPPPETSAGKSLLLNLLLGAEVVPSHAVNCTRGGVFAPMFL